jgi:hypothetical protein
LRVLIGLSLPSGIVLLGLFSGWFAASAYQPNDGPGDSCVSFRPQADNTSPAPLAELSGAADAQAIGAPGLSVAVSVPAWNATFVENAGYQYDLLSTAKLPIMLTFLDQLNGTPVSGPDLDLLDRMIRWSDNNAATALWERVGGAPVVGEYLKSIGVNASLNPSNWGAGQIAPADAVAIISHLISGDLLRGSAQLLALRLLETVTPNQTWGLPTGLASGTFSGVKNGWYHESDGWELNSVGFVIPVDGPTFTYAVYSRGWHTMREGIATIEAITSSIDDSIADLCPVSARS